MPRKRKEHVITRTRGAARLLPLARRLARQLKRNSFRTWTFSRGTIQIRQTANHIWYRLESGQVACNQTPVFYFISGGLLPPWQVVRYYPDIDAPSERLETLPDFNPPGHGGGDAFTRVFFNWVGGYLASYRGSVFIDDAGPMVVSGASLEVDPGTGDYFWDYALEPEIFNRVLAEWFDVDEANENGRLQGYTFQSPPYSTETTPPGWDMSYTCATDRYQGYYYPGQTYASDGTYHYFWGYARVSDGELTFGGNPVACGFNLLSKELRAKNTRQFIDTGDEGEIEVVAYPWAMQDYRQLLPTSIARTWYGYGASYIQKMRIGHLWYGTDGAWANWVGFIDHRTPYDEFGQVPGSFYYQLPMAVVFPGWRVWIGSKFLVDWDGIWFGLTHHELRITETPGTWDPAPLVGLNGSPGDYDNSGGLPLQPFPFIVYGKPNEETGDLEGNAKTYQMTAADFQVWPIPNSGIEGITVWGPLGVIVDGASAIPWNWSISQGDGTDGEIFYNHQLQTLGFWNIPLEEEYLIANPTHKAVFCGAFAYQPTDNFGDRELYICRFMVTGTAGDDEEWMVTSVEPLFLANNIVDNLHVTSMGRFSPWILIHADYHFDSGDSIPAQALEFGNTIDGGAGRANVVYNVLTKEYRNLTNDYNVKGIWGDFGPIACPNSWSNP